MTVITQIPVVTLRDIVVYTHGVLPLFIGTQKSISALEQAQENDPDKQVLLVAKRDPDNEDPGPSDLFEFGTVASVVQLIRMPDKTIKILVEGGHRALVSRVEDNGEYLIADAETIEEEELPSNDSDELVRSVLTIFDQYTQLSKKSPTRSHDVIVAHLRTWSFD